jgi:predicted TIM-barrel fold metal-dependent hydrolase
MAADPSKKQDAKPRIIDFRVRPSTPEMVDVAKSGPFRDMLSKKAKPYDQRIYPVEELVGEMDAAGIEIGVMQGRDVETTMQWKVSNDHVAEVAAKFPKRFVPFAGVDPHKGMAAVRELDRAVKELGMKGLSLDPYMHRAPADDRIYFPLYAKCVEHNIPVILTAGPGAFVDRTVMADASPATIDVVARYFPELTIIASHGCYPYVLEMISVALRNANVYFEFSGYELFPGSENYVKAANTIISKKVLFGSAHPLTHFNDTIARHATLAYTPEARQNVYYNNGRALLERHGIMPA